MDNFFTKQAIFTEVLIEKLGDDYPIDFVLALGGSH